MFQLPGIIPKELIDETLENWQRVEREEKEKLIEQLQRKSQRSDIRFKAETEQDKSVVNLDFEEIVVDEENKRKTDINQNTVSKRFCKKCCIPKPPRAHHCSACNTCWLKMDHHCLWINNCVAKDNYKMFFCMVFYAKAVFQFGSLFPNIKFFKLQSLIMFQIFNSILQFFISILYSYLLF
ncbi:unnamed protein product [Paramecium sonneborni]|uniref:Palmitoyltransferase n=1 Tax=Paramecium sonneborni TaxID=65129 RepID=A0A8S1KMJ2_9CILI|nr:unnamed protein product [Paramecium sonneborni]